MSLYSEILDPPQLRFDYSSTFAVDVFSKRGLTRFGPYDSAQYGKDSIRCGILYSKGLKETKNVLIKGLVEGEVKYKGFQSLFQIPLTCEEEIEFETNKIEQTLQNITQKEIDIVFVLIKPAENIYKTVKNILLGNGIPSQVVISEKINYPQGRQWILENLSLAAYAKTGGTPWVVANPMEDNQLILGVSRAQDRKNYLVGFVTIFTQNGDFILLHSKAPVIKWEEYIDGLTGLIVDAVEEYKKLKGTPSSIIVHLHKRPGWQEIGAIENALKSLEEDIPYALIHLNEYSNFRLFDTGHRCHVPPKGLKVDLSSHEALLLTDGRIGEKRNRMGVPRVLDVVMDKRSSLPSEYFSDFVKQIYDFSHVNWRGFNASAIPITLNYSKLIARMIVEIGASSWNQIIASGKLRDKAWFL
jgi:vacuolar-type H+-ATPase subunit F/Vma7